AVLMSQLGEDTRGRRATRYGGPTGAVVLLVRQPTAQCRHVEFRELPRLIRVVPLPQVRHPVTTARPARALGEPPSGPDVALVRRERVLGGPGQRSADSRKICAGGW